jgi:hypothetical protein
MHLVPSPLKGKKWRAVFSDGTHTDFGAEGYEDYTTHHDPLRRERYRQRHRNDYIENPRTAGALSWYILWGRHTSLVRNLQEFKQRFKDKL